MAHFQVGVPGVQPRTPEERLLELQAAVDWWRESHGTLDALMAWWRHREAALQAMEDDAAMEWAAYRVERRWIAAIRRQADVEGVTTSTVVNQVLSTYWDRR
jgi:hypothetical protein